MNRNWRGAKAAGSYGEEKIKRALEDHGCVVNRVFGHGPHDLVILEGPADWPTGEVECKRDRRHKETGRVAIEIARDGFPSGLATTTAQTWAFELGADGIFLVDADALRDLVADPRHRRTAAGDDHRTTVCLLPLATLTAAAMHVIPPKSRQQRDPSWSSKDPGTSSSVDRREHCYPHQPRDFSDPRRPGWISSTCTRCSRWLGSRPAPEPERVERRRPKEGPTW